LYYDIFSYPLKPEELYLFLHENSIDKNKFGEAISQLAVNGDNAFGRHDGYFYLKPNVHYVKLRLQREEYSGKMWRIAGLMTHIIKRFPFVRAVLVTGTLSKNNSDRTSDLDFMVITQKNRLWISRTLLMLFKKLFLLNSYKYFCINYFITEDNLEIEEKNVFSATEMAHLKATFNQDLMYRFIKSNEWIKKFFPNYETGSTYLHSSGYRINNRKSYIQKIAELFFAGRPGDLLDEFFLRMTYNHWRKKYSNLDEKERNHMFKSTHSVSKTHPQNMQKKILNEYRERLKKYNCRERSVTSL
jgi:hypothetical protein